MQKICNFIINNKMYMIVESDKIEGKDSYVGRTDYVKGVITLEKGNFYQKIITLRHELMHVWLYENGYTNQEGGNFSFEDVCEFVAHAIPFINNVEKLYTYEKTH